MSASKEVQAARQAQLEQVHRAIMGDEDALPPRADPEAMSRQIMERILTSTSFEDVFTQQSLTPWRTLIGRTVVVQDVHFNRSGFDGQALYAVCDLIDAETGESITVTCGGQNVLAQLVVALREGWVGPDAKAPRPLRMIENTTAEGYGALWLEAA